MKLSPVKIQQPDHRNNGQFQFTTGWTGGGAQMCVHLSFEEYEARVREKLGPGRLVFVSKGDATKHELLDDVNGEFRWELAS